MSCGVVRGIAGDLWECAVWLFDTLTLRFVFRHIKQAMDARKREKEQESMLRAQVALDQGVQILQILNEYIDTLPDVHRNVKKTFWRDFYKHKTVRADVFKVLESTDFDEKIKELLCR